MLGDVHSHWTSAAVIVLAAALTASSSSHVAGSAQLKVPVKLTDPACNDGRGLLVPQSSSESDLESIFVRTTVLSDRVVLVGTSSAGTSAPRSRATFVIHAFTPRCTVDRSFGTDGVANILLPPSTGKGTASVSDWAPDGTGVVVVGSTSTTGFAMRLTSDGRVDRSFGTKGVATLVTPHPSSAGSAADTVAVAPSGHVLVGADDGAALCCASSYVADLEPGGSLDRSFGTGGWTSALTTGSRITQLAVQPGGTVLVAISDIETGEGNVSVDQLSPGGTPSTSFAAHFRAAMAQVDPGSYFAAELYPRPAGGFALMGTAAASSAGEQPMDFVAAGFLADGSLDASYGTGGTTQLAEVDGNDVAAVALTGGSVVFVDEPWIAPRSPLYEPAGTLRLTYLTSRGVLNTSLVAGGVVLVPDQQLVAISQGGFDTYELDAVAEGDAVRVVAVTPKGLNVLGLRG